VRIGFFVGRNGFWFEGGLAAGLPQHEAGAIGMSKPEKHCVRIPECGVSVPAELGSVGLCISHFTWSVENTCAEMHREIALCKVTSERGAEVATYIDDCAVLLARVISNRRLSDDLKKRVLCSVASLMNLRESLDRAGGNHTEPRRPMSEILASAIATERFSQVKQAVSVSSRLSDVQ